MIVTEASFADASAVGTVCVVVTDAPEEEMDVPLAGIAAEDFLSAAVVGDVASGAGCWERPGLALFAASPVVAANEAEVCACVLKFEVRFEEPRFDESKLEVTGFEVSDAMLL